MKRIYISTITIILFLSCQANAQDDFYKIRSSHSAEVTLTKLKDALTAKGPRMEVGFVDGYSAEGKLIEVEVTAERLS